MTTVPVAAVPQPGAGPQSGDGAASRTPRVDVLAYPSATTTRFALSITALLAVGLFVGSWLHNTTSQNDVWTSTVAACGSARASAVASGSPDDVLAANSAYSACTAPVERVRAAFAAAGGVTAALGGLLGLYAAPLVLQRRRRLRPPGPELEPMTRRFEELAAEAGVTAPTLALGSSRSRDGFTYGRPGRYCVVIPPAVAVRWDRSRQFDALARHELAHARHHDVVVAWLTRGLLYAVVPMLSLPVVFAVATADLSLLPAYSWRAAVFAVVVLLIANATLRAREHDADLRAAGSTAAEADLLELMHALPAPQPAGRWRRLLAHHPSPHDRVLVLQEPGRLARVTFLDAFVAAFLAALSIPLLVLVLTAALTGTERPGLSIAGAGTIGGTLLGATLGLGLWRQTLVARVSGARTRLVPVAAGVALGLVLGQAASLAQSGSPSLVGFDQPAVVLVSAVAGAGAVALLAGLGELWADAAPRLRSARPSWSAAAGSGAVLFAVVLSSATSLQEALDGLDAVVVRAALVAELGAWPLAVSAFVLTAVGAVALVLSPTSPTPGPAWLVPDDDERTRPAAPRGSRDVLCTGLAAGVAAGAVVVGLRALAGPPGSAAEAETRFYAFLWLAAAVGTAAAVGLVLLRGRRGAGLGLVAAPVATVVVAAIALAMNTALGGDLTSDYAVAVLRPPLGLGLALLVLVAPVALIAAPSGLVRGGRVGVLTATATGTVLAAAVAATVLVGRAQVAPDREATVSAALDRLDQAQSELEGMTYSLSVAPALIERYRAIEGEVRRLAEGLQSDAPTATARLMSGPVPDLRDLLREAEALSLRSEEVLALHARFLTVVEVRIDSLEALRQAVVQEDEERLLRAQVLSGQADEGFWAYARGVLALREG